MSRSLVIVLMTLLFCLPAHASEPLQDEGTLSGLSISTGFGIPYAMIGVNVNYRLTDQFEAFVGKGTWDESWGVRVFPISHEPRLSLSLIYAVNTIITSCQNESCDITEDGYAGYNVALGFKPESGKDGWEFDIVFVLTQGDYAKDLDKAREAGYEAEEEGSGFEFSLGYRWSF